MSDGIGTHVMASFATGFVASVALNPIDVIKTRVMNMKLDCAMKIVRTEGVMALYKVFIPTISRQGPFAVVLFVTLEQVWKL
nr:mitochondrial uncoupling protein 4 [Quercus suber]